MNDHGNLSEIQCLSNLKTKFSIGQIEPTKFFFKFNFEKVLKILSRSGSLLFSGNNSIQANSSVILFPNHSFNVECEHHARKYHIASHRPTASEMSNAKLTIFFLVSTDRVFVDGLAETN